MAIVETVRPEDFPRSARQIGVEAQAIKELQPGGAIRFPCRWKHSNTSAEEVDTGGICGGRGTAYAGARRNGFRVNVRCRDGMVYVMRMADDALF
jgi:hypothetical protein